MGRDNNNAGLHMVRYSVYGKYDDLDVYDQIVQRENMEQKKRQEKKQRDSVNEEKRRLMEEQKQRETEERQRIDEENIQSELHPIKKGANHYVKVRSYNDGIVCCEICHKKYLADIWYRSSTGQVCRRCFSNL